MKCANAIECVERYRFDGREFGSIPAVARYIEDSIGAVLDSTPLRLPPRDRLAVYAVLVQHRERLCQLLAAVCESDATWMSIFDHPACTPRRKKR